MAVMYGIFMKRVIGRVFLGIFAVILIGVVALAVYLFGPEKPAADVKPTLKDADGKAYLAAVDDAGETYAVVTDAQGNRWAASFENGKVGETVINVNDQFEPSDVLTEYSGPMIEETRNPNEFTGVVESENTPTKKEEPTTKKENSSSKEEKPEVEDTTVVPQGTSSSEFKIDKYREIFAGNTYIMEFTTNDPDLGETPVMCAAKNGNIIIDTSIEGISCKMLYRADKDKTYLLLDNYKKYSEVPESLMGDDFNMSDLNVMSNFGGGGSTKKEVTKSKATINGKTLDCESYVNSDGSETKYYFDGDSLVRLDSVDVNGKVNSTFISRLSTDVPDSTFDIPSNYGYLNLSWLGLIA